jgi:hypothetical protein
MQIKKPNQFLTSGIAKIGLDGDLKIFGRDVGCRQDRAPSGEVVLNCVD